MRLIDADLLIESIQATLNMGRESFPACLFCEVIDEQPTAFDVDKVVETLMKRFRVVSKDEDLEWNRAIDYAVKIMEGGGVE